MRPTLVLNVVGLTSELLGENTPNLSALAASGAERPLRAITPAVTCSAQATYLTGLPPSGHGIVGNGWYFRDLSEVMFWRQSNRLVQGEKVWERGRRGDSAFTAAKMFWWYNMYSSADWSATPRPQYPADGRKIPDFYAHPSSLHRELEERFGTFPLFHFWGPGADIVSSEWIARASLHVFETRKPTMTLVYLPHLDYNLQRLGPRHPDLKQDLRAVDALCGELIEAAKKQDASVVVLSEYGIVDVSLPVHPNRVLREAGLLAVRREKHGEILDAGASEAFAVADHQVAHVYVKQSERVAEVAELFRKVPGVGVVMGHDEKRLAGLDHPRSGELVLVSDPDAWFTYYYWLDDALAPDYARTVDIHRKPGYDPVELFLDPKLPLPKLKIGLKLLSRKLGSRALLDVIGLDASLVRGSHGRVTDDLSQGPVILSSEPDILPPEDVVEAIDIQQILLDHVFGLAAGDERTIVDDVGERVLGGGLMPSGGGLMPSGEGLMPSGEGLMPSGEGLMPSGGPVLEASGSGDPALQEQRQSETAEPDQSGQGAGETQEQERVQNRDGGDQGDDSSADVGVLAEAGQEAQGVTAPAEQESDEQQPDEPR